MPRRRKPWCSAARIFSTLPLPPNSPTKRPAGFEATRDAFYDAFRPFHPVQRGVAKDRVKAAFERKPLAVHNDHVQSPLFCGLDLAKASIGAKHGAAGAGDFFGQGAVAAAQVQNHLARFAI